MQPYVNYDVSIDPDRLELAIKARFRGDFASGDALVVQTPNWVPGDYSFALFARDIFDLKATDLVTGAALEIRRDALTGFRVLEPGGDVELSYRVYAFEPDFGQTCGILNRNYAALLGTWYLFCKDHIGPCHVRYHLPDDWNGRLHHASGAIAVDETAFDYPSYEILLDTPIVLGDFTLLERTVGGVPIYACFVDRAVGFDERAEEFADELAKIAQFFHDMFGGFPFADYTFVFSFNPMNYWGMEHLTSTMCGLGPDAFTDEDIYQVALRVCAHEMFHAWNVKRLRPTPLLDLEHRLDAGCFTEGLWVAEGFTRYYEFVTCTNTGTYSVEQFFSNIIGYHDHVTRLPSYERVSVVDSSLAAYLNHSPSYSGQANNSLDYYDKGMLIAFGLDGVLRMDSDTNLNEAFSAFFHKMVSPQNMRQGELGYTTDQVFDHFESVLPGLGARLAREVCQPGGLDTLDLLRRLGFTVTTAPLSYLGIFFTDDSNTISGTLDEAPAGMCGLAKGDVIETINGYPCTRGSLIWAAAQGTFVTLRVLRGHERLDFTFEPTTREAVSGMTWSGDALQRSLISNWFGQPFESVDGQAIALDFYKNFHGIDTLV
jgi:predicted metalloprotease with PDZ domain